MIIIACGSKKLQSPQPVQAQHLYIGCFFKKIFSVAITLDKDVRILSAHYGLLRLNDMVTPYEFKMTTSRAKELQRKIPTELELVGHLLPRQYIKAIEHLNPIRIIPEASSMGNFMQLVSNVKKRQPISPDKPSRRSYSSSNPKELTQ